MRLFWRWTGIHAHRLSFNTGSCPREGSGAIGCGEPIDLSTAVVLDSLVAFGFSVLNDVFIEYIFETLESGLISSHKAGDGLTGFTALEVEVSFESFIQNCFGLPTISLIEKSA